jgi:hypothetical protein
MDDATAQYTKIIPFFYVFPNFAAVAPAGNNQQQLQFVLDFDFEVQQIHGHADIAKAAYTYNTRPIPNCTVLFTDSSSQQQFSNNPVPWDLIMGDGEHPYFLPQTVIFKGGTVLQALVANYDAAVTYNLYITLIGRGLFS